MQRVLCSCFAALLVASVASAQPAAAPISPASASPNAQAPNPHAAPPADVAIREGLVALTRGDVDAALTAFRNAVSADAARPDAHYYVAIALRRQSQLDAALEELRIARDRADEQANVAWQARTRIGYADTLERMPGRRDDARYAWADAQRFAETHGAVLSTDLPTARLAAIDRAAQLDATYEPVRQRIAERQANAPHHPNEGTNGHRSGDGSHHTSP